MKELLLSTSGAPPYKYVFNFALARTEPTKAYAQASTFAACATYQRKIYSFGGYTSVNVNWAYQYDPLSDTYTALAPLPTAMHGASAVMYNHTILIFGGNRADRTNDVIVYDIVSNTYSRKTPGSALPTMAYSQVAIAGDIVHIPPSDGTVAHTQYNVVSGAVTKKGLTGISATMDMSAIRCGAWVYCFGGRASRGTADVSIKQAYRINVSSGEFERLPDMPAGVLTGSQLYEAGSEIYIIYGNSSNKVVPGTMVYLIEKNRWRTLPDPVNGQPRFGSTTGYIDNRFYFIGGWQNNGVAATTNFRYLVDNYKYYPDSGPGSKYLIDGDEQLGYFGIVPSTELLTYSAYIKHVIPASGQASIKPDRGWLKFYYKGKVLYYSKTQIALASWDAIYQNGGVYGTNDNGKFPGTPAVNQYKPIDLMRDEQTWRLVPRLPSVSPTNPGSALVASHCELTDLLVRTCSKETGVNLNPMYKVNLEKWESFPIASLGLVNSNGTPPNSGRDQGIETSGTATNKLFFAPNLSISENPKSYTEENWRAVLELKVIGKDNSGPGPKDPSQGDMTLGYFGETTTAMGMPTFAQISTHIGATIGTVNTVEGEWFKFAYGNRILFVSKSWYRTGCSWEEINTLKAATGVGADMTVFVDGNICKMRPRLLKAAAGTTGVINVLKGTEFADLMYRVVAATEITNVPFGGEWASYTALELGMEKDNWSQTTEQGNTQAALCHDILPGKTARSRGVLKTDKFSLGQRWRMVLEVIPQ